jgi:peptidoglycan/xylan/chitin deacetylase (PgdA/CDA1 family)
MSADLARKAVLNALYFSGVQGAARFWTGGVGAILMLHRVQEARLAPFSPNAHLSVAPAFLDRMLGALARRGYRFVTLDALIERLSSHDGREVADPVIAITLDDGYRDNLLAAAPVFRKHQAPYTIYCSPGLVEGTASLWWEDLELAIAARSRFSIESPSGPVAFDVPDAAGKRKAYAELLEFLTTTTSEKEQRSVVATIARQCGIDAEAHRAASIMTWKELRQIADDPLCEIGAHTVQHYAIARLDRQAAMDEMRESARIIEMETGRRPRHFAFPCGYPAAAGRRDFALAREAGFASAVTTRHGVLYPGHVRHLHALPRISINGRYQSMRYVDTLLSGLPTLIQNRGRKLSVA